MSAYPLRIPLSGSNSDSIHRMKQAGGSTTSARGDLKDCSFEPRTSTWHGRVRSEADITAADLEDIQLHTGNSSTMRGEEFGSSRVW